MLFSKVYKTQRNLGEAKLHTSVSKAHIDDAVPPKVLALL